MDSAVITWLLVDNSAFLGGGLYTYPLMIDELRPELRHLGNPAITTSEAIDRVRTESPDVVLLDLKMGKDRRGPKSREAGVACAEELALLPNRPRVVLFSNDEPDPSSPTDRQLMARLDRAGASCYLTRDVPVAEVAQAIIDAYHGLPCFREGTVFEAWRRSIANAHPCLTPPISMTPGQHRVMVEAYRSGLETKQLAKELRLSEDAVQAHLREAGMRTGEWPKLRLLRWAGANCPTCRDEPS